MKIFELKCEVYLKEDINLKDSFNVLSKFINYSLSQNRNDVSYKTTLINNYCFGNLYPTQNDGIYKKNNTYKFLVRSIDKELIEQLELLLCKNLYNNFMLILSTEKKEISQFFINELYSATPVIVSDRIDDMGRQLFWSMDYNGDITSLQKRLQSNLEKKLKQFCCENVESSKNFIQEIELKNQKPQSIYFKTTKNKKEKLVRLIGNKFKIIPNKDDLSQKLAFLSLAVGLGEKSSLGGGFCLSR